MDRDAVERRAQQVRADLQLGPLEPVPEIVGVLEQAGLLVLVRPLGAEGPQGIYVRRPRFAAVLLNGSDYLPRFRFTGAHELGHHVLEHYEAHIDQDLAGAGSQEREANAFAASFLMPRRALHERVDGPSSLGPLDVLALANELVVSYDSLVNRLHNVGLLRGARHRDELKAARTVVLTDQLRERRPAQRWRDPADYVRRALEAYERYDVSLDRLAELVGRDRDALASILARQDFLHPEDAA